MYIPLCLLLVFYAGYFTDASLILNGKTPILENIDTLTLSCDFEKTPDTNFAVKKLEIKAGQRVFASLLDDQTTTEATFFDITATGYIDNVNGRANLNLTIWRVTSALSTRVYKCFAAVVDESEKEQVIHSNSLAVHVVKPNQQQTTEYTWNQLKNVDKLDAKLEKLLLLTSKFETRMEKKENGSAADPKETQKQLKDLEEKFIQQVKTTQKELQTTKEKEAQDLKKTFDELKKQIANIEKNVQTVSSNQAKPNQEVQELKKSQEALKTQISNLEKTTQTISSNQAKPNPEVQEIKKSQEAFKTQISNLEKTTQTISSNQAKPSTEVQELKKSQEAFKTQISNLEKTTQTISSNQAKPNPEVQELKKSLEALKTQISNSEKTIQTLSANQAKPNPEVQELKKNLEALKSQSAKLEEASKRGVRLEEGSYSCGYDYKDFPKAGADSSKIEEVQVQYKQKFAKSPFVFQSVVFQDVDIEDEIMYAIDIREQTNAGFVGMCVKYQTPVIYELQVKWFAIEVN